MAAEEDRLLTFLRDFAAMSEQERDAAIEALPESDRSALIALEAARSATAGADLMEVLDSGHGGLDRLREVTDPAELLTVVALAAREQPDLFAEALFAAIVLYRGWGASQPTEIVRLREQWHWHVHHQIQVERQEEQAGGDA
jgi:hypothetical protein